MSVAHRIAGTLLAGCALLTATFAFAAPQPRAASPAVLPGGNSKQPINIEAVKLDYFDKERKLIYTGNVVAIQGDSILKSSVLTIFLSPKETPDGAGNSSSTNQVRRMLAAGPVTLIQRDQVGTGDNGVYEKLTNTVVLTGNVTLSQGPNVTKGDKLTYDTKTGQAIVTGRVKSMFLPSGDEPAKSDEPTAHRPVKKTGAAASSSGGL